MSKRIDDSRADRKSSYRNDGRSQLKTSGDTIPITEGEDHHCELERQDIEYLRSEWDEIKISNSGNSAHIVVNNYVGIIGLPSGATLSIQPKVDCELLYLLAYTEHIDEELVYDTEDAGFESGSDLKQVLAQLYLSELQRVIRRGLQQEYRAKETDEKHLRGQLQVHKQLQQQGPQPTRFECRYSELTHDTPLNQLVLAATTKLCRWLAPSPLQSDLLHHREMLRQQVSERSVTKRLFDNLEVTHLDSHYKRILPLAKLILAEEFISGVERPEEPFPSLVFNMPTLFESVIITAAREVLPTEDIQVTENDLGTFIQTVDRSESRSLEPDLILRNRDNSEEVLLVGDAKWKTDSSPSRNDLYQMAAYQAHNGTPGILLYPDSGSLERAYKYTDNWEDRGRLLAGSVDVKSGGLSESETKQVGYEDYTQAIESSLERLLNKVL
ncbi:McrC family protein [Natronorubrum sp. A-ect3]|uniref:McrC family protein n=1 Tax=Natronorubrum sp. A-ect3 TaxID=3242698 RepID=UPI00359EC05B